MTSFGGFCAPVADGLLRSELHGAHGFRAARRARSYVIRADQYPTNGRNASTSATDAPPPISSTPPLSAFCAPPGWSVARVPPATGAVGAVSRGVR